jgi:hypothetical protein
MLEHSAHSVNGQWQPSNGATSGAFSCPMETCLGTLASLII